MKSGVNVLAGPLHEAMCGGVSQEAPLELANLHRDGQGQARYEVVCLSSVPCLERSLRNRRESGWRYQ